MDRILRHPLITSEILPALGYKKSQFLKCLISILEINVH